MAKSNLEIRIDYEPWCPGVIVTAKCGLLCFRKKDAHYYYDKRQTNSCVDDYNRRNPDQYTKTDDLLKQFVEQYMGQSFSILDDDFEYLIKFHTKSSGETIVAFMNIGVCE